MNRRKFLQLLGFTAPVVAIAPKLMLADPIPEKIVTDWVVPKIIGGRMISLTIESGQYRYVRSATDQPIVAGNTLWFTDKNRSHVIPIHFKMRQPPLQGQAIAISSIAPFHYAWVRMPS